MPQPARESLLDWFNALVLWLALGFSVGWYYATLHLSGGAWLLPLPDAIGGVAAYYYSQTVTHAIVQALHWLLIFPLSALGWVGLLCLTAPYFGGRHESFSWTLWRMSLCTLPLSLPGPWLAWNAAAHRGGWSVGAMLDVAFRQEGLQAPDWLTPVYVGLAILCLALQYRSHRDLFHLRGRSQAQHFALTAALHVALTVGWATLLAYPLRYVLEGEIYHSAY